MPSVFLILLALFLAVAGLAFPGRASGGPADTEVSGFRPRLHSAPAVGTDSIGHDVQATAANTGPAKDPAGFRTALLAGGSLGAVHAYGLAVWWKDGFGPDFRSKNEGWFGADTEHGGQDKLGHFMFAYAGTRLLTQGFEGLGNTKSAALRLGTATVYGALTSVEFIDGFAHRWHFSPEDFVMNTAGAVAAVLSERSPGFDRLIDFRIHYLPSARPGGRRSDYEPVSDYAGQTYYVVAKAEGVAALDRLPGIRLLELSVGYGARGFEDGGDRQQYTYVGISINVGKLLREHLWKETSPRARKTSDNLFEFVQFRSTGAWATQP